LQSKPNQTLTLSQNLNHCATSDVFITNGEQSNQEQQQQQLLVYQPNLRVRAKSFSNPGSSNGSIEEHLTNWNPHKPPLGGQNTQNFPVYHQQGTNLTRVGPGATRNLVSITKRSNSEDIEKYRNKARDIRMKNLAGNAQFSTPRDINFGQNSSQINSITVPVSTVTSVSVPVASIPSSTTYIIPYSNCPVQTVQTVSDHYSNVYDNEMHVVAQNHQNHQSQSQGQVHSQIRAVSEDDTQSMKSSVRNRSVTSIRKTNSQKEFYFRGNINKTNIKPCSSGTINSNVHKDNTGKTFNNDQNSSRSVNHTHKANFEKKC